jgi:hypothetical protein
MTNEELRNTLHKLRTEIDGLSFREPAARERVRMLISGIEQQLENAGVATPQDSLIENLKTTIEQFELEHPKLGALLNQLLLALSTMGI